MRLVLGAMACWLAAFAPRARADNPYLPAAKRLWASLDYEQALDQLARARRYPGTTPQELVEIELYTGLLRFETGDAPAAREAFRAALALDPEARLPSSVSPKEKVEFALVQRQLAKLKLPASFAAPAPPTQAASPPERVAPAPAGPPKAAGGVPPALTSASAVPRLPAAVLARPVAPARSTGPFWLFGGAAALGLAGGVFGLLASHSANLAGSTAVQLDVAGLNADAGRQALTANVLFAAAGAVAVGAGAWLFTR